MKKLLSAIYIILLVSCVNDDGPCHQSVKIINNSNKTLFYQFSTTPTIGADPSLAGNYFKILPHSSKKDLYGGERGCYENRFEPNNIVYYNFFDATIVESEDWETIRENDMVLERKSFTLEQMNEANWEVIFN